MKRNAHEFIHFTTTPLDHILATLTQGNRMLWWMPWRCLLLTRL
jgi:hypothetical protein